MMVEENAVQSFKIAEAMQINDLETLKVLADPMRLNILEYLMKPSTVKRIAEKLGKPPTKLYYHFNLLEKHGLIQLVDTRVVSGIIEKHYQASARSYQVGRGLLAPGTEEAEAGIEITLSGLLADTKNDLMESRHNGVIKAGDDAPKHKRLILQQRRYLLTEEEAVDLYKRVIDILEAYDKDMQSREDSAAGMQAYKMTLILHPTSRVMTDDSESDS